MQILFDSLNRLKRFVYNILKIDQKPLHYKSPYFKPSNENNISGNIEGLPTGLNYFNTCQGNNHIIIKEHSDDPTITQNQKSWYEIMKDAGLENCLQDVIELYEKHGWKMEPYPGSDLCKKPLYEIMKDAGLENCLQDVIDLDEKHRKVENANKK